MTPTRRATYVTLVLSLIVLGMKLAAYFLTGSVALLSDAAESIVNVAAAIAVIYAVHLAGRPADYEHPYGHAKAEYLSSALEGAMILLAAGVILATAVPRLFDPSELAGVFMGAMVALLATLLNGGTAIYLRRTGERANSPALASNARHLFTDVWTSIGVLVAVIAVSLSGVLILDPVLAILVSLNIVREGWQVLTGSLSSLLDARLPEAEEGVILKVLDDAPQVFGYHRLRSRRSGYTRFAEVDVFVEPHMGVNEAHDLVAELEDRIVKQLPDLMLTIHIEPYLEGVRAERKRPREEFPEHI